MAQSTAPVMSTRGVARRLFVSVWLAYALFATTNIVRETYLAVALGGSLTIRVDPYLGLHSDLFEIPGRGAYINSNPGASMLAAVPYGLLVAPVIRLATRLRPSIVAPKPPARYDDPRPNRTTFMNASRARGLDIVLGLAALGIQFTLMAPLGALVAVLMYVFLANRLRNGRRAFWLALLFAFGTPVFFRAAFLNQNLIIAHLMLAAYVLIVGLRPRQPGSAVPFAHLVGVGALLGFAVVCDYSAVPLLLVFATWVLVSGWRHLQGRGIARAFAALCLGGFPFLLLLLGYQYAAFGSPLYPAQHYMPPTPFSVLGWNGMTLPTRRLLIGNLFDPTYGLFAFCPLLILAFVTPFLRRDARKELVPGLAWIMAAFVAVYVFSSANEYANLQFNTGVRYLVPAVPLLFIAAVPAMFRLPRPFVAGLVGITLVISVAVSMTRENVLDALRIVFARGPVLPITLVLERMRSGYPGLDFGHMAPIALFLLFGATLYLIWRRRPEVA